MAGMFSDKRIKSFKDPGLKGAYEVLVIFLALFSFDYFFGFARKAEADPKTVIERKILDLESQQDSIQNRAKRQSDSIEAKQDSLRKELRKFPANSGILDWKYGGFKKDFAYRQNAKAQGRPQVRPCLH